MRILGVDLGTQSCKAVVLGDGFAVRGEHAVPVETAHPGPGQAEQDPRAWERAAEAAIAGALKASGDAARDIEAMGVSGQLDGCVAVDAQGEPLHPALIWQDRRATAELAGLDAARTFALTGQVLDPSHLAPKARWLAKQVTGVARFHQPVSYLVERFTGVAVLDPAHASTTLLYDLARGAWSNELLAAFELDAMHLPAIAPATSVAGPLRRSLAGLRTGIPVAVGTGDDFATPLGAGLFTPGGRVAVVLGTAEVVGALAETPVRDPAASPMVETHAYPTGCCFVENPGWLSGGAVRWVTRLLGLADDRALDRLAATAPPGSDGVVFIPALTGAMTPVWRSHARGTLHGLTATHGPQHIARAVLEGLAFACRDVVERLASLGLATDEVLLLGGGSRSPLWRQIRADVLGRPHAVASNPDSCPIGAGMVAAVASGAVPELPGVAEPVVRVEPGADRAAMDDAYGRYGRLVTQVAPLGDSPW